MSPDITRVAASIRVEPAALAAVVAVESSGSGLNPDGRPVIRLEAHLLWRYTAGEARSAVDRRFRVGGPQPWEGHTFDGSPYHGHQSVEWVAYLAAVEIDPDAAMRATSWGMGQVLGEYEALHFGNGQAGRAAFGVAQSSTAGQLDTMARFIQARPALLSALRAKDWSIVARNYNGSGKVADYSGRLAAAYARA